MSLDTSGSSSPMKYRGVAVCCGLLGGPTLLFHCSSKDVALSGVTCQEDETSLLPAWAGRDPVARQGLPTMSGDLDPVEASQVPAAQVLLLSSVNPEPYGTP